MIHARLAEGTPGQRFLSGSYERCKMKSWQAHGGNLTSPRAATKRGLSPSMATSGAGATMLRP